MGVSNERNFGCKLLFVNKFTEPLGWDTNVVHSHNPDKMAGKTASVTARLHPLVIVALADHHTRAKFMGTNEGLLPTLFCL